MGCARARAATSTTEKIPYTRSAGRHITWQHALRAHPNHLTEANSSSSCITGPMSLPPGTSLAAAAGAATGPQPAGEAHGGKTPAILGSQQGAWQSGTAKQAP